MKILFLSRWFPYPLDNGSKLRVHHLIRHLASRHQVDLISFTSGEVSSTQVEPVLELCRSVMTTPYPVDSGGRLTAARGLLSSAPRHLLAEHSVDMERLISGAVRATRYDLVIASQMAMVPYALKIKGMPRIFEEIELATFYDPFHSQPQPLRRLRSGLTWWKARRYVASSLSGMQGGTVVSRDELELVKRAYRGKTPVQVAPNGVEAAILSASYGSPRPDSLVFNGSLTFDANYDAMQFFLGRVFPVIRAMRPGVELAITGRLDGVDLDGLDCGEGVHLTGYLDDVRPVVARSWACIAPIRKGGGTRLKILEALALGTPVVATSKGAQGLDLQPGKDILTADDPVGLAAAIVNLLDSPQLRQSLSASGRRLVAGRYTWEQIGPGFGDFAEEIARIGMRS